MTKQPNLQIIVCDVGVEGTDLHLHRFNGRDSGELVLSRGKDLRESIEIARKQLEKLSVQLDNIERTF
jgi:hypothetical protein